jgi:hypothetical protein
MIFKGFNCQKRSEGGGKEILNGQISIFGFQCVAIKIQG